MGGGSFALLRTCRNVRYLDTWHMGILVCDAIDTNEGERKLVTSKPITLLDWQIAILGKETHVFMAAVLAELQKQNEGESVTHEEQRAVELTLWDNLGHTKTTLGELITGINRYGLTHFEEDEDD